MSGVEELKPKLRNSIEVSLDEENPDNPIYRVVQSSIMKELAKDSKMDSESYIINRIDELEVTINRLAKTLNISSNFSTKKHKKLFKVASEFNVATQSIVDVLREEGFDIDNRPNSSVSPEMYMTIENYFSDD